MLVKKVCVVMSRLRCFKPELFGIFRKLENTKRTQRERWTRKETIFG